MTLTASLWNGDSLDLMKSIPDASVDLIACDLPYGVTAAGWDKKLPMAELWAEYRRIIKPTGNIVLTSIGMFTAELMMAAPDLYKYSLVWKKSGRSQHFHKDYRPLAQHEDVLIFSKGGIGNMAKIKPTYNPQGLVKLAKPRKSRNGNGPSSLYNQWAGLDPNKERVQTHDNYPTSVQFFASVGLEEKAAKDTAPQTQKPVALMDWIIRTYSNPGDVVLDNCLGSGTTGVAALAAGRSFIGIEKMPHFYEAAVERIQSAVPEGVTYDTDMPMPMPMPKPKRDLVDEIIERKRAAYWASQRDHDTYVIDLANDVDEISYRLAA